MTYLQKDLKHTVAAAYLVFRAIDEIEDHEEIGNDVKYTILTRVSKLFKQAFNKEEYLQILEPVKDKMPEVTLCLGEWIQTCPKGFQPLVMNVTSFPKQGDPV
ncbi:hypothetical protein [Alkalihalobacillus deserti]|uniref:hypothetical protein n=1 Tax=Alkalihalobacillus deserti TaxID=2879466 RepID=UPI0027DF58D4|nr:hypothetical protein [Alkalihalobacillus deserti]